MTTNIDADVFIFQNNDETLTRKYIADSGFDDETKNYYYKMISVKHIIEKNLSEEERFLFEEYFSGYSLKEMRRCYDLSKFDMSKYSKRPRIVLSDAIFKFYVIMTAPTGFPLDTLNQFLLEIKTCFFCKLQHKATLFQDLYKTIYSFNIVNRNIFALLDKDFTQLDYVYRLTAEIRQLQSRAFKVLYLKS